MFSKIYTHQMLARLSLLLICVFFLSAWTTTVPGTGRNQLNIVSDEDLAEAASIQYKDLIEKSTLSTDTAKTASILKVGKKISEAAEAYLKEHGLTADLVLYNWEFNLIESPDVNAFCMPGGKIAFYTGILPYCQDETGIAVIMGHEVAHAIAKHGGERSSQKKVTQLGGIALKAGMSLAGSSKRTTENTGVVYKTGVNLALLLPYSRSHESEADRIGLSLMAMAGYDPNAAVGFWERMAAAGSSNVPNFLSTHPSNKKRIANIQKFIPEAMPRYKAE